MTGRSEEEGKKLTEGCVNCDCAFLHLGCFALTERW